MLVRANAKLIGEHGHFENGAPYGRVASTRYAGSTGGTAVKPSGTAGSIDATAARTTWTASAGFGSLLSSAVSARPERTDNPNATTSPNRLGARNRLKRGISL